MPQSSPPFGRTVRMCIPACRRATSGLSPIIPALSSFSKCPRRQRSKTGAIRQDRRVTLRRPPAALYSRGFRGLPGLLSGPQPSKVTIRGCSSVGRAPRCQRGCRGFESHHPLCPGNRLRQPTPRGDAPTPFSRARTAFLRPTRCGHGRQGLLPSFLNAFPLPSALL